MADKARLLELALQGLRVLAAAIQKEIAELEQELAGTARDLAKGTAATVQEYVSPRRKRRLSVAARKAISLAQKARWRRQRSAGVVKRVARSAKTLRKKLNISPAERKLRADRMKQYWAEKKKILKAGA